MMAEEIPANDALTRELARERTRSARRINLLRLCGVSAFFALFILLGGVLGLPGWSGNLGLFTAYWLLAVAVFWAGRRLKGAARLSSLAIAVVDVPMVFLLQRATLETSPSASGVAGFTAGVYVLIVILAALSLESHLILLLIAVLAAAFEILLQHLAGVGAGAMASTAILLGLAAAACSYARLRLVVLVERVERDVAEQRRAEAALREAERTAALAALGRELSGTLDPTQVAQRTVDSITRLLRAQAAALFRLDPVAGTLVAVAASGGLGEGFPAGAVVAAGAGAGGGAVARREPVTAADVLAEPGIDVPPDLWARITRAGARAVCAVPLIVRDAVVGVLEVGDAAGRQFTAEEVHLAQAVADHAALSLENARLYAELAARVREIEASQEQLLQTGKLAAVGQLVSGVAHEINNPLAVIVGQAQLLMRRLGDPDQVERVDRIYTSGLQAAKIVRELQTFVRPRPRETTLVDLRDVIGRILALREEALRVRGIAVLREVGAAVSLVRGDASQLEQVLLNLVLNAEQALAGRPDGRIAVRLHAHEGRVRVVVADTGPGIPSDVLPRIFEPFFSTKAVGQGTGLGLSICYSIVQSHGGRLTAQSRPGLGATFVVDLPAHDGVMVAEPAAAAPTAAWIGRGHVLVVDDEPDVAEMLGDLFRELGVRVTAVADAESAWRELTRGTLVFDAVTLDLRMPGTSGRALFERLEQRVPAAAARVIFLTGDTADAETEQFLGRAGRPILTKPVALEPLAVALTPFLPAAARRRS
jgi:signal transduction histidine kinase/ActR/RegA family two-component response regulator